MDDEVRKRVIEYGKSVIEVCDEHISKNDNIKFWEHMKNGWGDKIRDLENERNGNGK